MSDAPPPSADADADAERAVRTIRGHGARLGIVHRAQGDRWVELALPFRDDLIGDARRGAIAPGAIVALMDAATGRAAALAIGRLGIATLDLRIDHHRAAAPGRAVIGRGECHRVTPTVAFVRGVAHDGDPDDPVATVAGTFMRMDAPR